jgi:hypothetical protein
MSLDALEKGQVSLPILCKRLRDRQEYLHGTYAEKIFIPTKEHMASFAEKLPEPLIRASEGSNLYASFERRLERTRHVVTRSDAEREWENTLRIRERLLSRYQTTMEAEERQRFEKRRARSEFGDALNSNVAFSHLLDRKGSINDVIQLTKENFHVVNCGALHFTKWDAEWLFLGGKSESFSIEDLSFNEDLFLRSEISEDENLRVGSIPLYPLLGKPRRVVTTTTVGLYQIGSGMYEWASDLTRRLVQHREQLGRPLTAEDALQDYELDPEWVNDDSLIISQCRRDTSHLSKTRGDVILISADKRLGNQLANSCNVAVHRIDPRDYIAWSQRTEVGLRLAKDPFIVASYLGRYKATDPDRILMYTDTGSLNSFLARLEYSQSNDMKVHKFDSAVRLPDGRRQVTYDLVDIPGVGTNLRSFYHAPVVRQRRFKPIEPMHGETRSRRSALSFRSFSSDNWRSGM